MKPNRKPTTTITGHSQGGIVNNVLIIGSGAREHALLWKLRQSPAVGELYCAPGNAGTAQLAENLPVSATDIDALTHVAEKKKVDLTVVGSEDALALGIVDRFHAHGLRIFGPLKRAAQIETSKGFAKRLMVQKNVPTAAFATFRDLVGASEWIGRKPLPVVIKADGLAQGKGAYICRTLNEAEAVLRRILIERVHPHGGDEVVVEEFLTGQEVSLHALCDGVKAKLFSPVQDHKAVFDGNVGPNTGGMGTFSPIPGLNGTKLTDLQTKVISPILNQLAHDGPPFTGCLYPGLMLTKHGPKVLEYNARFGDPETQVLMRLLKTDLFDLLTACVDRRLDDVQLEYRRGFSVCVVLASGGYPGEYQTGFPISGIRAAEKDPNVVVFHAGTKNDNGTIRTWGGRVLSVTATGLTLRAAVDRAYAAVAKIHFKGRHFRKDIAAKALAP